MIESQMRFYISIEFGLDFKGVKMKKTEWSAEAVALTLDTLSGGTVLDMCALKCSDGRFGIVSVIQGLNSGVWEVKERKSGEVLRYPSIDALIADGWVVD